MKVSQQDHLASRMCGLALIAALWFLATGVTAQAQAQPPGQDKGTSISQVERKNKAPVSKEVLRVTLPKPAEFTLPNGLTVLILEDRRFPTVTVTLNLGGAGALYEPSDVPGLASMTATMLREGTRTRSSKQIAEEIDKLGATINAFAPFESSSTQLNANGLAENMDAWMGLFTDLLLNPSFPADELTRVRNQQKAGLRQQRTQPFFLASERFRRAVFGAHPAAVVSTTAEALDAMSPERLAEWHAERYAPQNAILGIAGDVRAATLMPKLRQWFAAWKKTEFKEEVPPSPPPARTKKIYIVDRVPSVQTTLWVGNIAISRKDPDYMAVRMMNTIVGGGPAGRLFLNLRENKGYTYGYYSGFTALKYAGPWTASGDVRTEVTEGAMTEVMNEVRRIRDEPVPAEELAERKRSEVASFALSLEQPVASLNNAIVRKIYGFPADYWDKFPAMIEAVTAAEIRRVAQKYLDPDAIQIVAVGEAAKIKPVLEKFGAVEVWTTDGRPAAKK